MPQPRKQQFTKPLPSDATHTTMKLRRRGKDVEVPAVRFKGTDGRPRTRPVVQSGKTAGMHYREESEFYYGYLGGEPVRLCRTRAATEVMLADLVRKAERGEADMLDPFESHRRRPLAEHVEDFEKALAAKGRSAFHVRQTARRLTRCLVEGWGFAVLGDLEAGAAAGWLAGQRAGREAAEVPGGKDAFTVKEAAAVLGVEPKALTKMVRRLRLVLT